jgi:organic radical activating enzyme
MENFETKISWFLNDYCRAQCTYCPNGSRGGGIPPETKEYLRIAELLIDSYHIKQGRKLKWEFNGGEPLDMDDIVMLLKYCKTYSESIFLHTNGGKLWMDWWAIEPYVDAVRLTVHHWQNPSLVRYIVQLYQSKNKSISVTAPIRHSHVNEDLAKIETLEKDTGFKIVKTLLYINGDPTAGLMPYSQNDLEKIDISNGEIKETTTLTSSAEKKVYFEKTTWDQRYQNTIKQNPSYSGKLCNAGVETLSIGAQGWVSGSMCNNSPLGNIWHEGWMPPTGPQICTMQACIFSSDQKITKFL